MRALFAASPRYTAAHNRSRPVSFSALILGLVLMAAPHAAPAQQLEGPVHIGVIRPPIEDADPLMAPVARSAEQGAIMAEEEFAFNADMFGFDFAVVQAEAQGADVVAAAEELLDSRDVYAFAGGFDGQEARLLSELADERSIPFINLLAADDALRNQMCSASTFHMSPSAAMYLDALAGWYVRAGFRNWFTVVGDTEQAQAQHERLLWGLNERHFGAREAGSATMTAGGTLGADTVAAIESAGADLVVLLVPPQDQLSALATLEEAGLELMVTGFPDPAAQTREFFIQSSRAAPVLGSGMRATAWEPTLDAYGARELNARYMQRWGEPMEQAAWATYQAVKAFFEAATFTGSTEPESVFAHLSAPNSVFDVWKGIGTSFRPWDHQMRQPLYLVDIDPEASEPRLVGQLVGELPAIYMPGTDPVERLDQLGDLEAQSSCQF
ncbi:ABC transporter substrate-binding protein [Pelagibacterium sp. H642]|uniref:ABC transporter substrate-binding protein n=1 Tax=Pelagibacterium sp. H642 TaxID=1881069 RepID=UPI0028158929|nr:ABC transporter substrate-binding protein [Pelagibacterium sp. H642]WMT91724.1 ABC transporter substrate-binding protein [Pelagibacterium sp. H642]